MSEPIKFRRYLTCEQPRHYSPAIELSNTKDFVAVRLGVQLLPQSQAGPCICSTYHLSLDEPLISQTFFFFFFLQLTTTSGESSLVNGKGFSLRRQLHGMKRGALLEPRALVAVWGSFEQHVLDQQAGEARDQSRGCVAAREIAQTACPCTSIDLESCSKGSNNRADSPALRVQRSSQLPHWDETRLSLPLQQPWRAVGDVSTCRTVMPAHTATDNRQDRTSDVSRTGLNQAQFEISGSPSATA
jgi:hypothetical protein